MALIDLTDWIEEHDFRRDGVVWCMKRLSANDTLANQTHQAGPYLPRNFLFEVFPEIHRPDATNPGLHFDLYIDSHADHRRARAVWYNQKTRNEARITGFGGASSAVLDPESTGALAIFAFVPSGADARKKCHVWVCDSALEEDMVLDAVGPVEPGKFRFVGRHPDSQVTGPPVHGTGGCHLTPDQLPPRWLKVFPDGKELIDKVVHMLPADVLDPDERLMRRRDCEHDLFRSVEEAHSLPAISKGFRTLDEFLAFARPILRRLRTRPQRSLQIHLRRIFEEEGLKEGRDFTHGGPPESGVQPEFVFPSTTCYDDPGYPASRLRMLAVMTACRGRWRQVTEMTARIPCKHILTLQEGVSERQFARMRNEDLRLVVPAGLIARYPRSVRPELMSLESFIADIRLLRATVPG